MREVVLFIAMSLDGFIADETGGVDWLRGQDPAAEDPDLYTPFIQDVDTVVMGWNTYHQIVTELSPESWVYEGLTSYIITHRSVPPAPGRIFTDRDPREVVETLRRSEGKRIWICGGGALVRQMVEADLIDAYEISVIPVVLGGGVRLFPTGMGKLPLELRGTAGGNGIQLLRYVRKREKIRD